MKQGATKSRQLTRNKPSSSYLLKRISAAACLLTIVTVYGENIIHISGYCIDKAVTNQKSREYWFPFFVLKDEVC